MSRNHKNVAYLMFVVVLALAALDQTILGTALPVITRELRGDSQVSWVFSAYLIASTVVIPLYGKAADAYGSKLMLLTAISLFFVGSLACGFSANMNQLIISRGIQGAGAGGLMTLTMLGVVEMYSPDVRGKYQALLAASYGISTMFGPLLGGLLVENLSWQWAFFINLPGAFLALVILAIYFQGEVVREAQKVDLIGAAMLAAALIVGLLATGHESGVAETVGGQWILILGAVALFVTFVVIQLRTRNPVLPISLFSNPVFAAAAGISAVSGVALFAGVVFLPIYLQTALMQTPMSSAWHLLPLMFGITLSAIAGGKILRAVLTRTPFGDDRWSSYDIVVLRSCAGFQVFSRQCIVLVRSHISAGAGDRLDHSVGHDCFPILRTAATSRHRNGDTYHDSRSGWRLRCCCSRLILDRGNGETTGWPRTGTR